jgi:hypothetical protein
MWECESASPIHKSTYQFGLWDFGSYMQSIFEILGILFWGISM